MKSVIIGTAGHIDHGKTALVKALTGIDADRLAEEKRRGITIDLGFAHMDLPTPGGDTLRVAFVDVPGHERFVRNMLAGVGGIDLVLLVIAADESIKPQTREHLDILRMLGVNRMIAVITKSDAVDAETLNVVRLEVEDLLRPAPDEKTHLPIIAVSALTGAGLGELKARLVEEAAQVHARDATAITRLPIDRVFTMKGFGTVVTGTLIKGAIRVEDELEVLPGGRRVRVRGLQVHGRSANEVRAGQRAAVNLAGATTEDLARGMTLVPPATLEITRRADVHLKLLPSASRPLKNRARVHFHCQTMETVAEVILQQRVEGTCLGLQPVHKAEDETGPLQAAPGEEWMARLRFAESPLLLPMDRFIIRQLSPTVTIGGGTVMEIAVLPRQQGRHQREIDQPALLDAVGDISDRAMARRVARRGANGITLAKLIAETGETAERIEGRLWSPISKGVIVRAGNLFLYSPALNISSTAAIAAVSDFHKNNPLVAGMSKEALRAKLKLNAEAFAVVLESAARDKKLEIAGDLVKLPRAGVVLKDEEAESKKKIEEAFAVSGLKVPALNEVLAGLKIDKARATKLVTLLLREKTLMKVSDELVFHHTALAELRRVIVAQKTKSPRIDVAAFKNLTGISRKYAIPLLEYLDRERVTRRIGDTREIL